MAELKTTQNDADVCEFINSFADTEQKRKDNFELIKLMRDFTGFEPKMWGPSIIGFGRYHYKSERSRQEGDWLLVGFSPRKAAISLYVYTGLKNMSIYWMAWESLKEGKPVFTSRNYLTSIRKLSGN